MIPPNLVGYADNMLHLGDGMDAHNVRTGKHRGGHRRGRGPVTIWRRHASTKGFGEKRFARRPGHQWAAKLAELVQPRERLVGMRRLLRESKPRIQNDAL